MKQIGKKCAGLILVGMMMIMSCVGNAASAAPETLTKIKVGHLVALDMAPLFLAKELGHFKEVGLDVETIMFGSPGDNNAALAAGQIQLTINPFTLPYLGAASGSQMQYVSAAGGVGVMEVVAQGDLKVHSFDDLIAAAKQRDSKAPKIKIGSFKGDTLDVVLYRGLKDKGASYDQFEMVWFNDFFAMVQAFKNKQIDVLSHIKPYTTDLIVHHGATTIGTNSSVWGLGTPNCVTMVMTPYAKEHGDVVRKYLTAIKKSFAYMLANPEKAAAVLTKGRYYVVKEDVLVQAIKTQPAEVILRPNMKGVETAMGDLVALGYMKPVTGQIYDPSFLDAIGQDK